MAAYQYELLKCKGCGKTLGYIYICTKTSYIGIIATGHWFPPGRLPSEIQKTAYCQSCFQERLNEISTYRAEPKSEEPKTVEPRSKPKEKPMIH